MSTSFMSRYKPYYDEDSDEWVLQLPSSAVTKSSDAAYEIRLPIYAGRALAIGGNTLRPQRKKYRDWLLNQQGGLCAMCGEGADANSQWNLDHQPPLKDFESSKFIDYQMETQNRVIHQKCDTDQIAKMNHE